MIVRYGRFAQRTMGPYVVGMLTVLFLAGCGGQQQNTNEANTESKPMLEPVADFTDQETRLLRELGIAIFRNRLILDAQPPITDAQLAAVEEKVDGKVPVELLALWETSFGGELDYDYEIIFGDHLYTTSLRELFYPGSDHYHDLDGWIEHELELGQEVAEERGEPIPERTPFIPFGGFEYLERFYVSLKPKEYGSVIVYAQGIPWKGRLNEDSVTSPAESVTKLFDQLSLNEDPFDPESDEHAAGKDMVERIREIEGEHPELAEKLKVVVRSAIFDWQGVLKKTDFSEKLSADESKALRLALKHAVGRKDMDIINTLHKQGAPFNQTVNGTSGVLGLAMTLQAFDVVERLLDLNVDLGDDPILFATACSDELLLKLIRTGVKFDEEAIYSATETGAITGVIALAASPHVISRKPIAEIAATALERAAKNDVDAGEVESGKLGSYLTPEQYRERATALREFSSRLAKQE